MKRIFLLVPTIIFSIITTFYVANVFINRQKNNVDSFIQLSNIGIIESITVEISTQKSSGSGIIVQKMGNVYTVVTNRHVVENNEAHTIKTPDAYAHDAKLIHTSKNNDLAVLKFKSEINYHTAKVNTCQLSIKNKLFAAGFPNKKKDIKISEGQLILYSDKPLIGGYQIGYSNHIDSGMSGGAIVNSAGEVVGINGRSAYPIIPNYQYQDRTYPSKQLQKQMRKLSWGIPISKAVDLWLTE